MAIRSDYRITDDHAEIEDVCVSMNESATGEEEETITLTQNGNEVTVSLSMAKDMVKAINMHIACAND